METQERAIKPISPNLPNTEYKYLKLWNEVLDDKDTFGNYYTSLHNKIEASNFSELTIKESAILKELLKSRIITKSNLYDYYANIDKVVNKPSFLDKVQAPLKKNRPDNRYSRIVAATDTQEDLELKKERFRVFKLSNTIYKSFGQGDFVGADDFFKKDPTLIDEPTYEKNKALYVQEYFSSNFTIGEQPFALSTEQAEAMCNMSQVSLLNSRAGTGKTRVIMAKILFLLTREDVKPQELCLLTFDGKQTENIKQLLTETKPKNDVLDEFASQFEKVLDIDTLLSDITGNKVGTTHEEKEAAILGLLEKQKKASPEFIKNFYNFYLNDNIKIDRKSFKNPVVYFQYVNKATFLSLRGEYVESLGEKWIADFLYENNIDYDYKKPYYPSKIVTEDRVISELVQRGTKVVYPDFFVPKYKLLIEHSRINENEPDERNKVEFEKINNETWGHYRIRMQWKRDFWDKWRKDLPSDESQIEVEDIKAVDKMIETSLEQMTEGREKFIDFLKDLLEKNDVKYNKRDSKELIEDLWERNKLEFAKLVTSFCDRFLCSGIKDTKEFNAKTEALKDFPNIIQFYEIGMQIKEMKEFEDDQSQMVLDALKKIEAGKADGVVKKLKWILVDDFQDFTQGYYLLIMAMLKVNPEIKLFFAGDNWQTLYRMRGTDSVFIEKAIEFFPEIKIKSVPTNFRCKGSITQHSNKLMKRNAIAGMPAQSYDQDYTKSVFIEDVSQDKLINETVDESIIISDLGDRPNTQVISKYLHKCIEKIKENKDTNFLLVHKREDVCGMTALEFFVELNKSLIASGIYSTPEEVENHINFSLMSDTKSLEADIIIFLQFTSDVIPTVNSASGLFEVFGENLLVNLTDQQRLFYVAMTRAKSKIYILMEKEKESEFLEYLK